MELARCLGLSVQTRYCLKSLTEAPDKLATQPDITSMEIPSTSVGDRAAEKTRVSSALDSVPIPLLPPRKRLKLSHSERIPVSTDDSGSSAVVAEVGKSSHADTRNCPDDFVTTLLQSEQSSESPSALASCNKGQLQDSQAIVAGSGTVTSADVAATNFNSTAKNSFASICAPWLQQVQERSRRGRKPHQTAATAVVTAVGQQASTVHQNWATADAGGESHVVALTPSVATPTPNVIHIPENSRVLQTEDGMLIVCQSDGTVQIHGHTEGKPIPLDAIRSILAMDTTVFAAEYASEVPQETTQSLYDQLTSPQTDYRTVDQLTSADGSQNVIPVDGRQYVTVDGSPALMAYDPVTQSMVHINAGQGILTLPDGNTLVAVDGSQPLLPVDGACYADQGFVGSSALMHPLPNSHMQL